MKAKNTEWVYVIVIDGRVVKIGRTRDGIKSIFGRYLYGYKLPEEKLIIEINIQTFHAYESIFISDFKKEYSFNPN